MVEYAMGIALFCVVSIGAIQFTEDGASDEFDERADRAGAPDLVEGSTDGGTTDGGTTTSGGTDGPPPVVEEAFFAGFSGIRSQRHGSNPWTANLKVDVADADGDALDGVTVTGTWSYTTGSGTVTINVTCNQTNGSGACQFQLDDIPVNALPTGSNIPGVRFTMTNISGGVPPVTYTGGTQTVAVSRD
jgi:hypothetical protein